MFDFIIPTDISPGTQWIRIIGINKRQPITMSNYSYVVQDYRSGSFKKADGIG